MDLYSILGQQLSVDEALPPETAPAAAALPLRAQPYGAAESSSQPLHRSEASDGSEAHDNSGSSDSVPKEQPLDAQPLSVQPSSVQPSSEDYALALRLLAEAKLSALLASTVDRVRYITNASGIALALCEITSSSENREDAMVCHASSGPAAPEVGARMYIRSGITAESLRTRQSLRCDRASTDRRVNQESCKALGIESVLVMPVILNRNVVGMFQLFGCRPSAFTERDAITLRASIPQVEAGLQEAVNAGIPLGHIPWAEEAPAPVKTLEPTVESAPEIIEDDDVATVSVKVPVAFPIDSFRKPETQDANRQNQEGSSDEEVPAFLARLADEARPAPSRSWSQWFRPQW